MASTGKKPESAFDVVLQSYRVMHPVPAFRPGGSLYDQSSYAGRAKQLFSMINPMLCFVGTKEIGEAKAKLQAFRDTPANAIVPFTDRELWRAQQILDSSVHPSTGKPIPLLARLCAFMPVNAPITLGMLTAQSTGSVVFWQWLNQSYNAFFNIANSPTGDTSIPRDPLSDPRITAYALATSISCGLALGLGRARFLRTLPSWVGPYLAVSTAGAANTFFMRRSELEIGIPVTGEEQRNTKAAAYALGVSMLTRNLLLPLPLLALPAWIMGKLALGWYARRTASIRLTVEVLVVAATMGLSLPLCVAAVPQQLTVPGHWLELPNREWVTFNRGI